MLKFGTLLLWFCGFIVVLLIQATHQQNVVANNRLAHFRTTPEGDGSKTKKVLLPSYDVSIRKYTIRKQTSLVKVPLGEVKQKTTKASTTTTSKPTTTTTSTMAPPPTTTTASTTTTSPVVTKTTRTTSNAKPQKSTGDDGIIAEDCDCPTMTKEITLLKEESRKLNFRVSQLYIQLLQEIIDKRDDTLKYSNLENQLLNETVRHYQLREMHYELREMVLNMGNTLVEQRRLIRDLESNPSSAARPIRIFKSPQQQIVRSDNFAMPKIFTPLNPEPTPAETTTIIPPANQILGGPYEDCVAAQTDGRSMSGIYLISLPESGREIKAWCDFEQDPGGWLVIQRRSGGKTNFYRNFEKYKAGFGAVEADFWLGLDSMYELTNREGVNYKLHIDMEDWEGKITFVEYTSFRVTNEEDGYRLKIAHYSGDAGDSLSWHNNMKFTTKTSDNDFFGKNCANYQKGGWWYNMCAHSNLNGIYYRQGYYRSEFQDGIYWSNWHGASYSLKQVAMKIRPTE